MTTQATTHEAAQRNFIVQQGFSEPAQCRALFGSLMFQPRIVMVLVAIGILTQWVPLWLGLGVVLWWSAAFPRWNPFDVLYNRTVGARPGAVPLTPAPAPRRFAQGMAGAFSLGIAASLVTGRIGLAWGLEAFFAVAVLALAFGRLCFGSFVFHIVNGRAAFAFRTLPWARQR